MQSQLKRKMGKNMKKMANKQEFSPKTIKGSRKNGGGRSEGEAVSFKQAYRQYKKEINKPVMREETPSPVKKSGRARKQTTINI